MRELDVSAFFPPRARSLVHFGCSSGVAAEHFRRIQPECRYVALPMEEGTGHPPAGADVLLPGGMEEADPAEWGFSEADCLIYEGRAAEGLTAELLRRHKGFLAPRGQMVVLLENPGYFGRVLAALEGRSAKAVGGMTLERLRAMAEEAGLFPAEVQPVYRRRDAEERERPETKELLRAASAWQSVRGAGQGDPWAIAFLLRLVAEKPGRPLLVQAALGEALVTARVRLTEPHNFLMRDPGLIYRPSKGKALVSGEGERKIFLRQRLHYQDRETGLRQVAALRRAGMLILYELDDNPERWREDHEASAWLDFRGSHACQVSTQALAEVVGAYNPHVKVFRNELAELPPRREYPEGEPVTLFFGALNREEEWRDIMPVLNEAAERYGEGLRFRVLADKEFFGALRTQYKEFIGDDRYYGGKYVPYPVYARTLHASDISLLPLRDTSFNRTKSDLKFIESAGHGAAVLASPTVYAETVRDGETGFLYRSPGEFADRLRLLVEDRSRRIGMAGAAYRYVSRERLLSAHYEERLAWYEELLARKEELDRELLARLEDL